MSTTVTTTEQTKQLSRVSSRISEAVKLFFFRAIYTGKLEFNITALHRFVARKVGGRVAPGSPDRVMRMLRKQGVLDYEVVNRASSSYRCLGVTI